MKNLIAVLCLILLLGWIFHRSSIYHCYIQDKGLRELATNALSALVRYKPDYFAGVILEKLIPCTLSSDLCMRHGATLAVGEVILALHKCGYLLSTGWFSSADLNLTLSNWFFALSNRFLSSVTS